MKASLKAGLSSLPAPRNDYEIVVPEDEQLPEEQSNEAVIEDQADVDARYQAELLEKRIIIINFAFNNLYNLCLCFYRKIRIS